MRQQVTQPCCLASAARALITSGLRNRINEGPSDLKVDGHARIAIEMCINSEQQSQKIKEFQVRSEAYSIFEDNEIRGS